MADQKPQTPQNPLPREPVKSVQELRLIGKTVAKEAGGSNVLAFFENNKTALQQILPRHMTPERMLRVSLNALRTTPKLMECTVQSLFGAVVFCAQYGLEPNTPLGHMYLIPFRNNRKKITEVQAIPGYKGLIDLARRGGEVSSITAHMRYAKDRWDLRLGTENKLIHHPVDGDRGAIMGAYAVAHMKEGGEPIFEYMTATEIMKIRDGSQGYRAAVKFAEKLKREGRGDGTPIHPWEQHPEQMSRKTAIRRLANYLPMSVDLSDLLTLDNAAHDGRSQNLDRVILEGDFSVVPDPEPDPGDEGDGGDGGEGGQQEPREREPTEATRTQVQGARVEQQGQPSGQARAETTAQPASQAASAGQESGQRQGQAAPTLEQALAARAAEKEAIFRDNVENFGLQAAALEAIREGTPIPAEFREEARRLLANPAASSEPEPEDGSADEEAPPPPKLSQREQFEQWARQFGLQDAVEMAASNGFEVPDEWAQPFITAEAERRAEAERSGADPETGEIPRERAQQGRQTGRKPSTKPTGGGDTLV